MGTVFIRFVTFTSTLVYSVVWKQSVTDTVLDLHILLASRSEPYTLLYQTPQEKDIT